MWSILSVVANNLFVKGEASGSSHCLDDSFVVKTTRNDMLFLRTAWNYEILIVPT